MRVRLTVSFAGALGDAGDERDLDRAEAIRLIEAGFAVPVAEVAVETATLEVAPEKRAKRKK